MLPFSVVEFLQEEAVEVISSSWLNIDKNECHWPNALGNRLLKLIRTHASPIVEDKLTWTLHHCKVFKSYDSYDAARRGSKRIVENDTSTLETTDADTPVRRRIVKQKFKKPSAPVKTRKKKQMPKPKTPPPSPSSSDASESSIDFVQESPPHLNSQVSGYIPFFSRGESNDNAQSAAPDFYEPINQDPVDIPVVTVSQNPSNSQYVWTVPELPPTLSDVMKVLNGLKLSVDNQTQENKRLQDCVVTQMVLLKEKLNELLMRTSHVTESPDLGRCEVDLPVNTLIELESLQSFLTLDENFTKLARRLAVLGGETPAKITHHILGEIISNQVALVISFLGKGKKAKAGLRKTAVINLLYDTVRRTKGGANATNKEINDFVKLWLKNAADREGGKKRRSSQKVQPEVHNSTEYVQPVHNPTVQLEGSPHA